MAQRYRQYRDAVKKAFDIIIGMLLTMFPPIFQSLCLQKISFVQHFTRTRMYLE